MVSIKGPGKGIISILALVAMTALAVSCSGNLKDPGDAVGKMLKAHGGEKALPLLTSYEGRGFRKQIPPGQVATNYPFDVSQRGTEYLTRTYRILEGQVADLQVLVVGKDEQYAWSRGGGRTEVPPWEAEMIVYRFPMILERLSAGDLELEHVESEYWDGMYHVRFVERDNIVDVGIDEKTFLVGAVSVVSSADSSFSFKEEYRDYVRTDGLWFPNRFIGYFRDTEYYEFIIPVVRFGVEFPEGAFAISESDTAVSIP